MHLIDIETEGKVELRAYAVANGPVLPARNKTHAAIHSLAAREDGGKGRILARTIDVPPWTLVGRRGS